MKNIYKFNLCRVDQGSLPRVLTIGSQEVYRKGKDKMNKREMRENDEQYMNSTYIFNVLVTTD